MTFLNDSGDASRRFVFSQSDLLEVLAMLVSLTNRLSYINFISDFFTSNELIFSYRIQDVTFRKALFKMLALDVDPIIPFMESFYSNTGRPALFQMEILRSFILRSHFGCFSIKKWVQTLKNDHLLAAICGFHPHHIPNFSSFYDFINRFYFDDVHKGDYVLEPNHFSTDNHKKPKHHQKLENYEPTDTASLYEKYKDNIDHAASLPEFAFLKFFDQLAVSFSLKNNLINQNCTVAGDGSSLHTHSNPYGTKIDDDHRRYSDIDADIGWDSDLDQFYFGYTEYNISYINHDLNIDLPLFLTLQKASVHDALTSINALAQFKSVNTSLSVAHYCLDSASDNYPTHRLAYSLDIIPLIDINKRRSGQNVYEPFSHISDNGRPVCQAGFETISDGYDRKRCRHKFRCPFAQRKGDNPCSRKDQCSKSPYGRVFYIKSEDDIRLFGPIPYKSELWKKIYKDRSCTERINTRILNDYGMKDCTMHGRKRNFFTLIMIGINIHLDAFNKINEI